MREREGDIRFWLWGLRGQRSGKYSKPEGYELACAFCIGRFKRREVGRAVSILIPDRAHALFHHTSTPPMVEAQLLWHKCVLEYNFLQFMECWMPTLLYVSPNHGGSYRVNDGPVSCHYLGVLFMKISWISNWNYYPALSFISKRDKNTRLQTQYGRIGKYVIIVIFKTFNFLNFQTFEHVLPIWLSRNHTFVQHKKGDKKKGKKIMHRNRLTPKGGETNMVYYILGLRKSTSEVYLYEWRQSCWKFSYCTWTLHGAKQTIGQSLVISIIQSALVIHDDQK